MRHLNDGTLRRIYDEPLALTAADQMHYDGCAHCQARFTEIAAAARSATALLSLPDVESNSARAFATVQARIKREEADRPPRWYERWFAQTSPRLRPLATPAVAVLLAATLVTGLAATGAAAALVRIFEPHSLVAVQVSPSDFPKTAVALDFGKVTWQPAAPKPERVAEPAAAQRNSGFSILMPSSLPNGINGPISYGVIPHTTGSLTFDAAQLSASAAKAGVKVSPMPDSINGSTLVVNGGPALIELWGGQTSMPTLGIVQTRVPTVDSNGATVSQLEDYLLSQPGVPPDLAAQLKAIKDPTSILPIPIPAGLATSEPVSVNGVQGLLVKAAVGAGVVWIKNGVIYAVGGQVTPDQVLAIATSLH